MGTNTAGFKISSLFPILIITTLAIGLYLNTLKNGFVYDDEYTVVNNTLIKHIYDLPKLIDKDAYFRASGEDTYRPVVTFTYFIDYALYGLNPHGFHLTNALLHLINSLLLYAFLSLIIPSEAFNNLESRISGLFTNQASLISILFVAHPALTEAVNAISFREDLLVFLFYISSLIIFIFSKSNLSILCRSLLYAVSCSLYFLALLSKEMALTLPLIVLCYEYVYADVRDKQFRSVLLSSYNIGFVLVTGIYVFIRFYYFLNQDAGEDLSQISGKWLSTIPLFLTYYLKLAIFPVNLSADYVIDPAKPYFSTMALIVAISLIFVAMRHKNRLLSFGMLFFIITLMPVYNIIPLANPFAERYLYLPMVGLMIIEGMAVRLIFNRPNSSIAVLKLLPAITFFLLLGSYSTTLIERNTVWKNSEALWSNTIKKTPKSSLAHNNLGLAYMERGIIDKAIREYQIALELNPIYSAAYYNLGLAYHKLKRFDDAIKYYNIAKNLNNFKDSIYNSLGLVFVDKGQMEEAIIQFEVAVKYNHLNADAHANLGLAYYRTRRFNEAIEQYLVALKLNPELVEAHYNLGTAYLTLGLKAKAKMEFEIALRKKIDYLPASRMLKALNLG